jgi:hypothetical protein
MLRQVRECYVRIGHVMSRRFRLCLVRSVKVRIGQDSSVKSGYVMLCQVSSIYVSFCQVWSG